MNISDFQDRFADLILQLNTQLQDYQDIWHDTQLVDNNGQLLHGWQDIRHRHNSQSGEHVEENLPLE